MISSFSTALGTALGTFKTDLETAISDNMPVVIGISLGLLGIGVVWAVVRRFAKAK